MKTTHTPYIEAGIIPRQTVAEMVDAYNQAAIMIRDGFQTLEAAETLLKIKFGVHNSYDFEVYSDYHLRFSPCEELIKGVMLRLRKSAWKTLISRMDIKKTMSTKAAEDLEKKLEDETQAPDITIENIMLILEGMAQKAPDYAKEAVIEAFEVLTPGRSDRDHYKTNAKQARRRIGKKVILTGMVGAEWSGGLRVNYQWAEKRLLAVDKAFHLLDGKPITDSYRGPLIDSINTTHGKGQTSYFKYEGYLNGNLHITFLRPDLVTALNKIAGGEFILTD